MMEGTNTLTFPVHRPTIGISQGDHVLQIRSICTEPVIGMPPGYVNIRFATEQHAEIQSLFKAEIRTGSRLAELICAVDGAYPKTLEYNLANLIHNKVLVEVIRTGDEWNEGIILRNFRPAETEGKSKERTK